MKKLLISQFIAASLIIASVGSASAAIALDRTRVIFPGNSKNIAVSITNENESKPYLAQSWIEDANRKKIDSPLMVVPPLQRVDAGKKSIIRITDVAAASLPQDRESVFWFNVREVPPKSDTPNVLQVALQTRIKLFYRPAAIVPEKFAHWDDKLVLHKANGGYKIENPTPYYVTVAAITGGENEPVDHAFKAMMIEPKSTKLIPSKLFATPYVTTINDFGGKPQLQFRCEGESCHAVPRENKA